MTIEAVAAGAWGGMTVAATATPSEHSDVSFNDYAICGYQHDLTVTPAGVYWHTTITLDIEQDSNWVKHS